MKFINAKTGKVIIEFYPSETLVHDPILRAEFEREGITIPPAFSEEYQGKKIIFLSDEEFQKAFIEIYYPLTVKNKQLFQLTDQ